MAELPTSNIPGWNGWNVQQLTGFTPERRPTRFAALILRIPKVIRLFILDAVETFIGLAFLGFVFPTTFAEAERQAIALLGPLSTAAVSAARRHLLPATIAYLLRLRADFQVLLPT